MLDLQKALIAGSVSFLLATIIQFFRAFSEIRALQKGYVPLYQTTNRTKVDLTYIVVSALQAANSLLLVAICALNQQPKIIISLYSTFSLGCIIQLAINYHATNPKATISQTYILLYLIAAVIAAGSTYQYKFKTEILYLNTSTIILLFFLIIIDIFKPSRNAGILNLPQNGRFPSGETTASYWSLITFSWIQPLLSLGETKHLEEEDLPSLPDQDQMDNIIQKWYAHRNPENSPIWDTIIFTKKYAVFQIVIALITTTLDFSKPFFINRLLSWIQHHKEADIYHGILLLLGMFSASILQQILYSQVYLNGRHWGIQIRSVLVHEVFKKSLRRTGGTKKNDDDPANQGKIVSLMSTDINQLKSFITDIHSILIDIPLSIFYSITALIYLMGVPALSGLVVVLLSGPVSGWVLSKTYALIKITRGLVDKRIQVTNEALQGIRIIKYMAWESKFVKKIWQAREDELQSRLKLLLWNLLGVAVSWGSSIMVTFTSFFFYTVVAGHTLDAATAFTSISILSIVSNQLSSISELVSQVLNIQVTIVRLNSFLKEPELLKYIDPIVENSAGDGEVGFEKAEFGFYGNDNEENTNEFTLNCGSIQFPKGKLSCIIGPTGSGKTSLVLALLGEMKAKSGTYKIPENHVQQNSKSDISYCPQTPWLMSASIKDNILFGEEYDEDRYLRVVKACALLRDLELLQYGDLTTIGEKGVNLSGGQKQRVSLARAVYSPAKIILLDDPLSAVDSPTAAHLLNHCILGLLKDKTIVIVTHAINLVLPKCGKVIALKGGCVVFDGTPEQIMNSDQAYLLPADFNSVEGEVLPSLDFDGHAVKSIAGIDNLEGKATGSVKWNTYRSYIMACGGLGFVLALFFSFLVQTASNYLSSWWVQVWTDSYDKLDVLQSLYHYYNQNVGTETKSSAYYITIFGLVSLLELVGLLPKYTIQFFGGMRASRKLHEELLVSVLGSPMRFFEITPVGRIINRFSNDLTQIDRGVMFQLTGFASVLLGAMAHVFYYNIARIYLKSSRELKRIESVTSSPIYAQFGEALGGVSSIRAYGADYQFHASMSDKVDSNHRAFFFLFATNRWLQFRTSIISSAIVFVAGISILFSSITAGWAGVAFTFASQITNMIGRSIQVHASLEMSMNAVERVNEYSRLKQEPYGQPDRLLLPEHWPSEGNVEVKDLRLKYAPELPEVLKGVTFAMKPKEKIGVVGRTGAGKSTLSSAFFRIIPFSAGEITIDGIDISKFGVRDLRSRLTIIPQDPILFEGTLRNNLDPLNECSDAQLWEALKLTNVLESFESNGSTQTITLDALVNENGTNFSQGQRQLVCLARALLRSSKFIVMDEATASVDSDTDSKIQKTIRSEFKDCTILTIAHRLKTVIDYDRIIVLDDGKIKEIGTAEELLAMKGVFFDMCVDSGDFNELLLIARENSRINE